MDLSFRDASLGRQCASEKALVKAWGAVTASVLCRRLAQLVAADSIGVIRQFPFCTLLKHSDGQYELVSATLFVIRFVAAPTKPAAPTNDEAEMTAIEIITIETTNEA